MYTYFNVRHFIVTAEPAPAGKGRELHRQGPNKCRTFPLLKRHSLLSMNYKYNPGICKSVKSSQVATKHSANNLISYTPDHSAHLLSIFTTPILQ